MIQIETELYISTNLYVILKLNCVQMRISCINTLLNRLTPNDPYMSRTAQLTSKCCILYIYSTNIGTEYF